MSGLPRCPQRHLSIVAKLIAHNVSFLASDDKADINAKDRDGLAALNHACNHGHEQIAKVLIDNEADDFILHCTSKAGMIKIVEEIVSKGADVNEVNEAGDTPLMSAASRGYFNVVRFLIEKGADVNKKNYKGKMALELISKTSPNRKELVRYLQELTKGK